jgi:hypothetical protein
MGVEVVPRDIRAAAGELETAAGTVRDHIPTEVRRVSTLLPGSASGPKATALSATWRRRFGGWAGQADQQVEALRSSADTWQRTDAGSAARSEKLAREGVL